MLIPHLLLPRSMKELVQNKILVVVNTVLIVVDYEAKAV